MFTMMGIDPFILRSAKIRIKLCVLCIFSRDIFFGI